MCFVLRRLDNFPKLCHWLFGLSLTPSSFACFVLKCRNLCYRRLTTRSFGEQSLCGLVLLLLLSKTLSIPNRIGSSVSLPKLDTLFFELHIVGFLFKLMLRFARLSLNFAQSLQHRFENSERFAVVLDAILVQLL